MLWTANLMLGTCYHCWPWLTSVTNPPFLLTTSTNEPIPTIINHHSCPSKTGTGGQTGRSSAPCPLLLARPPAERLHHGTKIVPGNSSWITGAAAAVERVAMPWTPWPSTWSWKMEQLNGQTEQIFSKANRQSVSCVKSNICLTTAGYSL